jgi:hypothetical protein
MNHHDFLGFNTFCTERETEAEFIRWKITFASLTSKRVEFSLLFLLPEKLCLSITYVGYFSFRDESEMRRGRWSGAGREKKKTAGTRRYKHF